MAHVEHFRGAGEMVESSSMVQETDLPDSMPRSGSRISRREWLNLGAAGVLAVGAGALITQSPKLTQWVSKLMNEASSNIKTHTIQDEPFSVPMPPGFTCTGVCTTKELDGFSKKTVDKAGNTITEDERGKKLRIVFEYKTRLTVPVPGNNFGAHITVEFVQNVINGNVAPLEMLLTKTEGSRTIVGAALSEQELENVLRGIELAAAQLPPRHEAEAALGSWSEDRHASFTAFLLSEGKKLLQGSHTTAS